MEFQGIEDSIVGLQYERKPYITIIGVGGGGTNAVNHMFNKGIQDVSYVVCNTDQQDLRHSPIQTKVLMGQTGLGAGAKPEVAKKAVDEALPRIEQILKGDDTKMVFVAAGMGGGTGTGAAPTIAATARNMGILTVGIVTLPFKFEGKRKGKQALDGVYEMSKSVDALIVISNEKVIKVNPDDDIQKAFDSVDDVLTVAAKGIAEIITVPGYMNVDFADVETTLKNSGVALMNIGLGEGENRIQAAIDNAVKSPLLDHFNVKESKKILINIACSKQKPIRTGELNQVNEFMENMYAKDEVDVITGLSYDDSLNDQVRLTIIATGFSNDAFIDAKKDFEQVTAPTPKPIEKDDFAALLEKLNDPDVVKELQTTPAYERFSK